MFEQMSIEDEESALMRKYLEKQFTHMQLQNNKMSQVIETAMKSLKQSGSFGREKRSDIFASASDPKIDCVRFNQGINTQTFFKKAMPMVNGFGSEDRALQVKKHSDVLARKGLSQVQSHLDSFRTLESVQNSPRKQSNFIPRVASLIKYSPTAEDSARATQHSNVTP